MGVRISDEWYGRVTLIPGYCHVMTEFVCVWWFPVLPRRSMLFFRDRCTSGPEASAPIALSFKSVLLAHSKAFFALWMGVGVCCAVPLIPLAKPGQALTVGLVVTAFIAAPCLLWLLLRRTFGVASSAYKRRLAAMEWLPPHLIGMLQQTLPVARGGKGQRN